MLTVHVFHLVSLLFIAIINPYTPLFEIRIFKLFLYVYFLWFSYSYSWVVLAKQTAIYEKAFLVVWHLYSFMIYRASQELSVVIYRSLVNKCTCTSQIIVIVEENIQLSHFFLPQVSFYKNVH